MKTKIDKILNKALSSSYASGKIFILVNVKNNNILVIAATKLNLC